MESKFDFKYKIFRLYFEVAFILILCIVIHINNGLSEENITTNLEYFSEILPREKCASNNCSCADFLKLGDVCCKDTNSNYIKILTFTGNMYLHAGTFLGFNISRLILNNANLTVDENIFEGIISLSSFEVQKSSIQNVPDFSIVKDSITTIYIFSSLITSLEGANLQNLTLVFVLRLKKNFIRFIDPDVFKGTENIWYLDLSYNLLTSIPSNLLNNMKKLFNFVISYNNLLHVDNLFSVTIPSRILLDFNNITNTSSVLRFHKTKFEQYMVREYGENTALNLLHCTPLVKPETLLSFFKIGFLDLSNNSIKETTQPFFPCYRIGLEECVFTVEKLDLNGNKLQNLNSFLRNSKINELSASRNQIQYLTDQDFESISEIFSIVFQSNQIRRIDAKTFEPIKMYLRLLDLSFNYISSLNGSVRNLFLLNDLILSHNSLQIFTKDEFSGLNALLRLHLQNNKIKSLGPLQQIPYLVYLNITQNDVHLIRVNYLSKSLKYISLKDNPYVCNCRLQPFSLRLNVSNDLATDNYVCSNTEFQTNVSRKTNCPDTCSCRCIDSADISFILIDCSSKNLSATPQFFKSNLSNVDDNNYNSFVVEQNIYPFLNIEDRVLGLNLENNNLESIDVSRLPPNLFYLYLSNNKLRSLPDSIFKKQIDLEEVTLSENPWDCDCKTLKFKKWLTSKSHIIQDINNTRCANSSENGSDLNGKIIWTLTDGEICKPTDTKLFFSVSFGVVSLLTVCLTSIILYMKYNFNIKVFLYSHGFTFVKEEDLDHDKQFDAFISFSHRDDEFAVNEIISEIENKNPSIRLCIHYRHFKAGEFIYDNIIRAVQSSKRTLLILTRNFLESEWCLLEFRTALMQVLEDKVHRVIVIKSGDLPSEMDPVIKAYLNSTTYLNWGEKNFWQKLFYVLPTGSGNKKTTPRYVENNGIVLNSTFYEDENSYNIYTNSKKE